MSTTPLSDRPTPETDAKWEIPYASKFHRGLAMAGFARSLERQRDKARAQRDALAEALLDILKADEECEEEFAKMGVPPEPEHWTITKAKAALATLNQKDQ